MLRGSKTTNLAFRRFLSWTKVYSNAPQSYLDHLAWKSISSYAREVLEKRHEAERGWVNGWPPGYFENLKPLNFEEPVDLPPEPIEPLNTI